MGRLIRISIYALIILILYFWITTIIKSYQNDSITPANVELQTDTISYDTLPAEPDFDDSELVSNEDIVDGKVNYNALDEKVKKLEENKTVKPEGPKEKVIENKSNPSLKPAIKPNPVIENANDTPKATPPTKGDGGNYMVMAGSYLLKENAVKMVKKLKSMGYPQAEVVVFQSSEYHSVVAARFSTESSAKSAASGLKQKGVDSFVKHK